MENVFDIRLDDGTIKKLPRHKVKSRLFCERTFSSSQLRQVKEKRLLENSKECF
jgi:hypothetical protein